MSEIKSNRWTHVAVVVRDSVKVSFYINGVYAGGGTFQFFPVADVDGLVTIGAWTPDSGSTYQQFFSG